jgi:hypothetical protein
MSRAGMSAGHVALRGWRCGGAQRLRSSLLAAAFALTGCAEQLVTAPRSTPPRSTPPPINLSGYSPAFKEGFRAGCDTARGSARRDAERFESDAQYAQGWQDGRSICGKR